MNRNLGNLLPGKGQQKRKPKKKDKWKPVERFCPKQLTKRAV
jgi:hypothetical protein